MEISTDPRVSGNSRLKQEIIGEDLFQISKSRMKHRFLNAGQIGDNFTVLVRQDDCRSLSIKYLENNRTKEVYVIEVNRVSAR